MRLPAQVVITSIDGKLRRELLLRRSAEAKVEKSTPWLRRPTPGNAIGRELTVKISKQPDLITADLGQVHVLDLPPGEYYVQAIYSHWLVAIWPNDPWRGGPRPTDGTGDVPRPFPWFETRDMDLPIGVSKAVKLTVVADAGPARFDGARGKPKLRLEPRIAENRVIWGRQVNVEIRIVNDSDESLEVFNPLLNPRLYPRAFILALLDENETLIGDLLERDHVSQSSIGKKDWLVVPPGGFISSELRFNAGQMPGAALQLVKHVPPGRYFLELRALSPALSGAPACVTESKDRYGTADLNHPSFAEWNRSFPGPEICRSNRVELEILPRTGD